MANVNIREVDGGETTTPVGTEGMELDSGTTSTWIQMLNLVVRKIRETSGPTALSMGAVADGKFLARSSSSIVGLGITSQFALANMGAGIASTTNGATVASKAEMSTNKQNEYGWIFPTGSQKYVEIAHPLPSDYNGGTITAQFFWTANSTSTNSVVWGIQGRAYADNDAIDAAWGTAQEVTDANGSSAYTQRISAATSAITLAGSPAAGQLVRWRIYRLGSGSDNLAASAILDSVLVNYTRA